MAEGTLKVLFEATKLPGETLGEWSKGYRELTDDDKAELRAEIERTV